MSAVSEALIKTIRELQELPSLQCFSLGGGTNLALRYNHRQSIDIDFFCPDIIGKKGYECIVKEIKDQFPLSAINVTELVTDDVIMSFK